MNQVIKNGENIDFKVDSGSTWIVNITWTDNNKVPIDLTGYIGRMYLKRNYNTPIAFQITTDNLRLTLGNGTIYWNISDELTSTLSGSYIYDLELQSYQGEVTRLFEGSVVFSPEVTK